MITLSHYEKLKILYPSMTLEEYERWIQVGIRVSRMCVFKLPFPRLHSYESLRKSAESKVSDMVHQLIECEKIINNKDLK